MNGRRTVYIPVTKRADASTLDVVRLVKENLPTFQKILPDDVKVSYAFDQSPYVIRAINGLMVEGALGALLTGVMVLLFLRDWRSALIVVINIPLSLLGAIVALWLTRQTVNIMTLGGLALAIGILVDMSTVTIENVPHSSGAWGIACPGGRQFGSGSGVAAFHLDVICAGRLCSVVLHDWRATRPLRAALARGGVFNGRILFAFQQLRANSRGVDASTRAACGNSTVVL